MSKLQLLETHQLTIDKKILDLKSNLSKRMCNMKKQIAFLLCLLLISSILPAAALAQTLLPAAAITITSPQPGEVNPSFITVTGTGVGLPENNVVIQGLDDAGTLLGQTVATVNAELGAEGPWEATLEVRVAPGTTGQIYAYSASPADGSIVADAPIQVTFGQAPEPEPTAEPTPEPTAEPTLEPTSVPTPEPIPASIAIDIPLANEVVSNVEVVAQGTGSGLPENNLVVRA